jgi:xanthosine phosphorylase
MNDNIEKSKNIIESKLNGAVPKLAITLGSGLGDLAKSLDNVTVISYADLPGFPVPSVEGHAGELHIGELSGCSIICLKGRVHLYEGLDNITQMKTMIRTLKALGVETLALTNAAGSLNADNPVGTPVMITDHINFQGTSPLLGPNDDEWGPRFVGMDRAWDHELQDLMRQSAKDVDVKLGEGVYLAVLGPTFETPAEITMMKTLGADLVGMSTVAENILANHCGLRVIGCSAVTNLAAGMSDVDLSHDQTLDGAEVAKPKMEALFKQFVKHYTEAYSSEGMKPAA